MTKRSLSDLALLGGEPYFAEPRHVGQPNVPERDTLMRRIEDVLDRRWFTNDGPLVRQLERAIEAKLGVPHCVATSSGTSALELAIRAMDLRGEVIVPSFTFVATAHALHWHGIRPIFCDVDPVTHTLDPVAVERLITERTTAILPVHLWGQPSDTESLEALAAAHGLQVLYDASHAFGCSHRGRMIGTFGKAEVFSFHATKVFHTLEGGAIVTGDGELAARLRLMRNFGFAGHDLVISAGVNGKLNEFSAAVGLGGLERLDDFIAVNRRNYELYRCALATLPGIRLYSHSETEERNYHYVVAEVDAEEAGISRNRLLQCLQSENVVARRYFYPGCHNMEPYRSLDPDAGAVLPVTNRLCDQVLVLPSGPGMNESAIGGVSGLISFCVEHAADISSHESYRTQAGAV